MRSWRGSRARVRVAALFTAVVAVALCGMPVATASDGSDAAAQGQVRDVPDLAMIIAVGTGQTTVLRSGEPAFGRLRQLLRPTYAGTERVPDAWVEGRYPPVDFTVVWGLTGIGGWPQTRRPPGGDVAVERQDQLLVAADGTPWVRSDPAPAVQDDDIRWHRAPRSVFVQLEQAKVLGDGAAAAGRGASGAAGRQATGQGAGWSSVWWAVPGGALGLAVGVGGALLIRRAAARQGAGPPREEPRQELIDL
ncbi:hypothetical protein [Streptomyces sp. NPDC001604]|uniref:hypothetical protein n=1 Tax=Streptomyces sp. NPDC001604 TaxID=3364593 RepID=UPI0036BCACB3